MQSCQTNAVSESRAAIGTIVGPRGVEEDIKAVNGIGSDRRVGRARTQKETRMLSPLKVTEDMLGGK